MRTRMNPNTTYLFHFACFECQRSHKRSLESDELFKVCPNCAGKTIRLGRHFKPPKSSDSAQWKKVRFLVKHGFLFQHVYDSPQGGSLVNYPDTLEEAREFVERYRGQAWDAALPEISDALRSNAE